MGDNMFCSGARPEVAVIIPAYDAEKVLGQQLAALARQAAHPDWEILVADNGSTDRTVAVATSWAERGLPVRVVDASASRGAAHARNHAAKVATAPVLLFCDADDEVTETWCSELLAGLDRYGIVGGLADRQSLNRRGAQTYPKLVPRIHPFVPAASMAIRRADFEDLGGFDEALVDGGEDIELCYRGLLAGLTVGVADRAVYRSRARSGYRAALRQATRDGRGTIHLVSMHDHEIVPRRSPLVLLHKVAWLASRLPVAVVSGPYRIQWVYRLGHLGGLVQGWRQFRTLAW